MASFIKATIIDLIVALFITAIFFVSLKIFLGQEVNLVFEIANTISINKTDKPIKENKYDIENKVLTSYPEYGTQYATIQIPRIDVDLPVYFGDTLDILKKGVGHSSGSYFPGEGGSIIFMGHNSKKVFRKFSELQKDDEIIVKTGYGEFSYKIYDMQIVEETETYKLPIQQEKEILMIYTCYPFNNIGYTTKRYVVYAN